MTSVKDIFTTAEAAAYLKLSTAYVIRKAKQVGLSEDEMREAGKRNYIYTREGIEKIRKELKQ